MHMINLKYTEIKDMNNAFEKCFSTDAEREKYMYMYSDGDKHYFKDIMTRKYTIIERRI